MNGPGKKRDTVKTACLAASPPAGTTIESDIHNNDFRVSFESRRPRGGRMPSTGGSVRRGAATPWSTGGGPEGNDQGSSLLERGGTRNATPGICKDEQEPTCGKSTPTPDTNILRITRGDR